MCDGQEAQALLLEAYEDLPTLCRSWTPSAGICCHISGWLYRRVAAQLELAQLSGIQLVPPTSFAPPAPDAVPRLLRSAAPEMRLVYVLDLFFGCPAGQLSSLIEVSEAQLRDARTAVVWHLLSGGGA